MTGKPKIQFFAPPPWSPTAYSKILRELSVRFRDVLGYDVGIFSYVPIFGKSEWNGITVDTNLSYYQNDISCLPFYQATYKSQHKEILWFLICDGWWLPDKFLAKSQIPFMSYCPIDCDPPPKGFMEALTGCIKYVSQSQFSQDTYAKLGISSPHMPLGVNKKVFKSHTSEEKMKNRKVFLGEKITKEKFVIGIVGINEQRKNFPIQLEAISKFFENVPEAKKDTIIYMHTYVTNDEPFNRGMGHHLPDLWEMYGLRGKIQCTYPMTYMYGLTEQQLADMYNCFDVLMMCTHGEGFGLPTLEAQACGVPVVGSENSATAELIQEGGIPIPCNNKICNNITNTWFNLPDPEKIAEALGDMFSKHEARKYMSKKAEEFSQQFDWDKNMKNWEMVLDESIEEMRQLE